MITELQLIPKENGALSQAEGRDAPTWPRPFHQRCHSRALPVSD